MTASGGLRVFPVCPLPRPNDTFGSAIRNGCFTSTPAVRFAHIAKRYRERIKSTVADIAGGAEIMEAVRTVSTQIGAANFEHFLAGHSLLPRPLLDKQKRIILLAAGSRSIAESGN